MGGLGGRLLGRRLSGRLGLGLLRLGSSWFGLRVCGRRLGLRFCDGSFRLCRWLDLGGPLFGAFRLCLFRVSLFRPSLFRLGRYGFRLFCLFVLLARLVGHVSARFLVFTFVHHGQDAGDLALRMTQAGAVFEHAGRRLETEVEELLARLCHAPVELVAAQLTQLPSSQRDRPLSSRTSS